MVKDFAGRSPSGRWILPFLFLLLFAGCSKRVELIPREKLFRQPDRVYPTVSPDGNHLAWIAPLDSVQNLWLGSPRDTIGTPLTRITTGRILSYSWLSGGDRILYSYGDPWKNEVNYSLVSVYSKAEAAVFTPPAGVDHMTEVRLYEVSWKDQDRMAVGLNWRDPAIFDLYEFNAATGETRLLREGPENLLWWVVDGELNVRGYLVSEDDGGQSLWLKDMRTGVFEQKIVWTIDDDTGWSIVFTPDGKQLYIYDSRGYNSTGLALYDPASGKTTRLIGDDRYDVRGVLINPKTHEVQGARIIGAKSRWVVLDDAVKPVIDRLTTAHQGNLSILNRSRSDSLWVVGYVQDDAPASYYLYDRGADELRFLFNSRDDLKGAPLARMEPVSYQARDGLRIEGYLTRPVGAKGKTPLVVYVHGGPWSRDFWGFNPEVQWFANRGYSCLQVNFRGSTGYGKQFLNAGNREWGRKMQDDLTDGVNWAVEQGYADADRVAIFGGSYGGYAALAGVTFTPNLYAAAVSIVGASDLVDYLASFPPVWNAYRTNLDRRVGYLPRYLSGPRAGMLKDSTDWTPDDRADIDFLRARSPLYNTDKISTPLLIAQGGRDRLVRKEVTDKFVARLRKKDLPVEYVVYDNAGHGLTNPNDQLDFYRRAEAFLASYVGGRFQK